MKRSSVTSAAPRGWAPRVAGTPSGWLVFVAALAASLYAWWPMLAAYPMAQGGDGPPYQKTLEAAIVSVTRYKEFPFWNAYECGGLPLWDNPQAPIGAPLAWPMFFVDTTMAMAAWYVVHSALGVVCMWRFARELLGLSHAASFVAGLVWAFSGFHQQHYSGGHFTFVPFLYFPLAWLLWRRAWDSVRDAVYLGLLVAWMFYEGAVYPLPHLVLILATCTVTGLAVRAGDLRRAAFWKGFLVAAVVVVVVGVGVAAARLLPVLDQLRSRTRPIGGETDALQWSTLRDMFLSRAHGRHVVGQTYVWPEYGAYFGPILLVLALAGAVLGALTHVELLVVLVVSALLMGGHFAEWAPWHVLKGHVFPFKEMRVPSRFRVEVSMALAAFVGVAIDRLGNLRIASPRSPASLRVAVLGVALVGVGDMMGVGIDWFAQCFTSPALAVQEPSPRLYFGGPGLAPNMSDQPRQNRGRLACWDEWGWGQGAPLWEGDVPQARALSESLRVLDVSRTQNTFALEVDAPTGGDVLLNATYDRQWQSDVGFPVDHHAALKVNVPPGHHRFVVRYFPRSFAKGLALTVITGLGVLAFFVTRRRSVSARP
jgi:hypothetical protein